MVSMKRSRFYTFFPPPEFLQMSVVGLDISDASLRFVELVETRKGFTLGRFGYRAIPRGVIESGEIKKVADFRAILVDIKKQHNLEFVAVSLPEEKAYLFDVNIPAMKYAEVRGAIELSLEEYIPLKSADAIFDYEIVEETESSFRVSVAAMPRVLVDGYLEAFSGTGITPTAFEVEAHSISRSVVPTSVGGACMIVDFGKTRTGISIVLDQSVKFTSTILVGGDSVTAAIAKNLNISYEEAEKIKRGEVLPTETDTEKLYLALVSAISILRDEITKHRTYWQTRTDDVGGKRPPVEKIYLCGGDSNLKGFVDSISLGFDVPFELANVFVNVNSLDQYVPEITFGESLGYATAIGLALRRPE